VKVTVENPNLMLRNNDCRCWPKGGKEL